MEFIVRTFAELGLGLGSVIALLWVLSKAFKRGVEIWEAYLKDRKEREQKFVQVIEEHAVKHERIIDRVFQMHKESLVALNNNTLMMERHNAAVTSLEKAVSKIS